MARSPDSLCYFLYLPELQFHWRRATEDGDHHLQRLAVFVYFVDLAGKVGEWAVGDAHRFVLRELYFEPRLVLADCDAINDLVDFIFRERRWIVCRADKSCDLRRRFHHVPDVIAFAAGAEAGEIHLYQHVAREEHTIAGVLFAAANFGDRFGRDQHASDLFLQPERLDARLERLFYLALEARVGVDDVPLHVRIAGLLACASRRIGRHGRRSTSTRRCFVLGFFCHQMLPAGNIAAGTSILNY